MATEIITVTDEEGRIDAFIASKLSLSRSFAAELIDEGKVLLNGSVVKKRALVKSGDEVLVEIPELKEPEAVPQDIPIEVVYEDDDLLVVNKPKGMVVHPAPGNSDGTLVNALLYHCKGSLSGINGVSRPGIVHRIDKDTSGLLIVAKNDTAHIHLAEQIKEHSFTREYLAICYGNVKQENGLVSAPIGRDRKNRQRMAVVYKNSKSAVTHYEVVERFEGFTMMRFRLHTGRTHQIRVHMSSIGHPIAGDPIYGPKKVMTELEGQCLHAGKIGFIHPKSGNYLEFEAELPQYFNKFKAKLKALDR